MNNKVTDENRLQDCSMFLIACTAHILYHINNVRDSLYQRYSLLGLLHSPRSWARIISIKNAASSFFTSIPCPYIKISIPQRHRLVGRRKSQPNITGLNIRERNRCIRILGLEIRRIARRRQAGPTRDTRR